MRQIRTSGRSKMSEGGKANNAPTRWYGPLKVTVASCQCGISQTFETRDGSSSDFQAIKAGWVIKGSTWTCPTCKTVA